MTRWSTRIAASCGILAVITSSLRAQDSGRAPRTLPPEYHARSLVIRGRTYWYQLFIPRLYTATRRWPIILFAHGIDERGTDNVSQLAVGLGPYVTANAATFPAVVVFPQMPAMLPEGVAGAELADLIYKSALDDAISAESIDPARVYVTGISSGATYTWDAIYQQPTRFAAAAPIAAGINGRRITGDSGVTNEAGAALVASRLTMLPIHLYCGANDLPYIQPMCAFDAEALGHVRSFHYVELPGRDHAGSWSFTYSSAEFWQWLFSQRNCIVDDAAGRFVLPCGYRPRSQKP